MSTQPDDFGFGEDEAMLRDSARKFFADNCSADKLHRLFELLALPVDRKWRHRVQNTCRFHFQRQV